VFFELAEIESRIFSYCYLHATWNIWGGGSFICVFSGYRNIVVVSVLPASYSYISQELKLQKKWQLLANSSKFEDPGHDQPGRCEEQEECVSCLMKLAWWFHSSYCSQEFSTPTAQ